MMTKFLRELTEQRISSSPAAKARFLWLLVAALALPLAASLSRQSENERNLRLEPIAEQSSSQE